MKAKRASRRAAALLCAAALLVNLISTAWAASAFLQVGSASAAPGETRSVYVSGSNLEALAGVQGIVSYDDTALELTGAAYPAPRISCGWISAYGRTPQPGNTCWIS